MIKAVFLDVDGTLVSHKSKSVPESAKEAQPMSLQLKVEKR